MAFKNVHKAGAGKLYGLLNLRERINVIFIYRINYCLQLQTCFPGKWILKYAGLIVVVMLGINVPETLALQKSYPEHIPDTTAISYQAVMDSIVVTDGIPKAVHRFRQTLSHANPLYLLMERTELITSVNGQTADLKRDLPSMIRFYTPQGIPLLTKYTSNNALVTTIPDNAVHLEIREPSAQYPNPDAPVIMEPDYRSQRRVALTPFKQTVGLTTGPKGLVDAGVSLERSAPPGLLERYIPELAAYSTTYSVFGATRVNIDNLQSEVIVHGSRSINEFGNLLGVELLEEIDDNQYLFLNNQYTLGDHTTFFTAMGHQQGKAEKYVEEYGTDYEENHAVQATSLTAGVEWKNLTIRSTYHDMDRSYPQVRTRMKRVEANLGYQKHFGSLARFSLESGYDFRDHEPSVSTHLQLQASPRFYVSLNAAHLWDPMGSEALNSTIREIQQEPHPWRTSYARMDANYRFQQISVNTSVTYKTIRLGWYGEPATIKGWIPRIRIDGTLGEHHFIGWRLEGAARSLTLNEKKKKSRNMPGTARLEGHAAIEVGINNMFYVLKADTFFRQEQLVREGITAYMGTQVFVSLGVVRLIGPAQIGLRVDNLLWFLGYDNKMIAWFSEHEGGMNFAYAPPLPSLSISVEL